ELAPTGAPRVDEGAIEDTSPAVIGIHAQVEQLAQETAALGLAIRQGVVDRPSHWFPLGLSSAFEKCDAVAHREESEPDNRCADRRVDDLVYEPGPEPVRQMYVVRICYDLAIVRSGEAPLRTSDCTRRRVGV